MSTHQNRRTLSKGIVAAMVALSLVAVACGSDQGQRVEELEQELADAKAQLAAVDSDTESVAGANAESAAFDEPLEVKAEYLTGIWLLDGEGALLRFSSDGTYAIDRDGELDTNPRDTGSYEVAGSTLTLISGGGGFCAAGNRIVWENVALVEQGRMIGTPVTDECVSGGNHLGHDWSWTIVSPRRGSIPS